jgi:hypothetical protein
MKESAQDIEGTKTPYKIGHEKPSARREGNGTIDQQKFHIPHSTREP